MRKLRLLLSLLLINISAHAAPFNHELPMATAADGTAIPAIPNQVLVKFKGPQNTQNSRMLQKMGATPQKSINALNLHVLKVPPGQTIDSYISKLKQNPNVEFAEPNGIVKAFATANDPSFSAQYYLQTGTGGIDIANAWDISTGVSSVVVAVLDTGITRTHPDLAASLWTGNANNGRTIEIDWNGDGDCVDFDEQCSTDAPDDNDTDGYHGTHSAGIIGAVRNNLTNIAGVAPDSKLMAVKVLAGFSGSAPFSTIVEGIVWAVDNGAKVINMSLGASATTASLEAAVKYAIDRNVVVVAAAGNNAPCAVAYPAASPGVISVGATTSDDFIANFSCTGAGLDLVAPGVGILSTTGPTGTSSLNGTSFSAPIVSGIAALALSVDSTLTPYQLTRHINFNTDDLGVPGYDETFGYGRANAYKTLLAVQNRTEYPSLPGEEAETFPYPNPYNPTTGQNVRFSLPNSMNIQGLQIEIFNLNGQRIRTLTNTIEWNGRNEDGNFVASGLYFFYAQSNGSDAKGKITIRK